MTVDEFIDRATRLQWARWRSDWGAVDCYGLIVLFYREVLGVELGPVPRTDIATGFGQAQGWVECPPEPGTTCWMAYSDGAPTHCGLLVYRGMVLHALGSDAMPGSVRLTRLPVMAKLHPDIRFYRRATC